MKVIAELREVNGAEPREALKRKAIAERTDWRSRSRAEW
jgi:hypothetical protein